MNYLYMYNTNYQVKYHFIKNELLNKLNNLQKQLKENKEVDEQDYKYNEEDIELICNKLYCDEYVSVFNASSIFDDIIDINMRKIYNLIITHITFKQLIDVINTELTNKYNIINNDEVDDVDNKYFIFISLFKCETFYLIHQIICTFLTRQYIDNDLLVQLEKEVVKHL
jgi:hypothetical protein